MKRIDELEEGLASLGIAVTPGQLHGLTSYLEELIFWNRKFNLVRSDDEGLIGRHILDALAPLELIRRNIRPSCRLADVGSGAGLPGIPLAIFLDTVRLYLIERSGKRAGFLRSAIVTAGLHDRAEVLHADVRGCGVEADGIVMRAFRPLPEALPLILPLLAPESTIFAYHGRRDTIAEELADPLVKEFDWEILPLRYGSGTEERHLLVGRHRLD
jgi:16S rRNA (guanine527-N7)-methyltransferase